MKCRLCSKFFNLDMDFSFIFYFPEICPECKIKFEPEIHQEVIPIDEGEIVYLYLYDIPLNLVQKNYLDRHLKIIYQYLIKSFNGYEITLFLDYGNYNNLNDWIMLIKPFKKILLFSLVYYDLTVTNFLY